MDIITKIKTFSKKAKKEISKILDLNKEYDIGWLEYQTGKILVLRYNNKDVITGDYKYIGQYEPKNSLWIWASSMNGIIKEILLQVKKIRSFAHLFDDNIKLDKLDKKRYDFYYQVLTSDSMILSSQIELEWLNELVIYLTGDLFWFNPVMNDNIQLITLSKVIEKYV